MSNASENMKIFPFYRNWWKELKKAVDGIMEERNALTLIRSLSSNNM